MDEVARSIRVSSTQFLPALVTTWRQIGYTLGGIVAGEGSFIVTTKQTPFKDGTPRLRFVFQLSMAERDRRVCEALRAFLGFGSIHTSRRRNARWLPQAVLTVASFRAHQAATIPFAEQFLLPCEKLRQFEKWRDALLAYKEERPKSFQVGRSVCSVPGCDELVRGRMLCRSHYYRATGY